MKTFVIIGKEPHYPEETLILTVEARNETHAKKYLRWLHALGSQKLKAYPTNEEAQYYADRF